MALLRILLIYEGTVVPAELLTLLRAGSHALSTANGLETAAELLSKERFDAVLLSAGYPAATIERFAMGLRESDRAKSEGKRTVLLSSASTPPECPLIDLHLSEPEDFAELEAIVGELASFRVLASEPPRQGSADLPVFEPEAFEDQCAHDADLMNEILDLFGAECDEELPKMAGCLAAGEFERASRLAHSLKGSLGSLHADRARSHAQDLEMAAREANAAACSQSLASLCAEIATLRARLLTFRQSCLS